MDCKVSWETIAGVSSAIIALCALGLTFWQAYVSRMHNKLSVKPYLTTWAHTDKSSGRYLVDIINNGIGPALIKSFRISVDGHPVKGQDLEIIQNAFKLLFPHYQYQIHNSSYLAHGYMMAPKESRTLVNIQFLGSNIPTPEEMDHASKRVKVCIRYESIYEEPFEYDSSKFDVIN